MSFLRALALSLALALPLASSAAEPASPSPSSAAPTPHVVEVTVQNGYHPDRIVARAGEPLRLRFQRTEYTGCTLEVVFPTLGIRATLPPGEVVEIDLGTPEAGEIPFHCGMNMRYGVVVVEPKEAP